jgi:hypothetical protein
MTFNEEERRMAIIFDENIVQGGGASIYIGSDVYPYTIINYKKDMVAIQEDFAKPSKDSNYYSNQEYIYSPNNEGEVLYFKLDKNKNWLQVFKNEKTNRWNKIDIGYRVFFGERKKYRDPSF